MDLSQISNAGWFVAVIGALALLFAYKSSKVRARQVGNMNKGFAVFLLLVVGFGALWISNIPSNLITGIPSAGFLSAGVSSTGVGSSPVAGVTGCSLSDPVTVTFSGTDRYNGSATGGTQRYRLDGGAWTTVSDAGTFTASPYQTLDYLAYNGATTGYFSVAGSVEVPCSATFPLNVPMSVNGTITSTVKDDTGVVIDGTTNNQTLGVGDVLASQVILKGQYEKDFPYGFVAVVDFNKTVIDDVKLLSGSVEFEKVAIPQSYTILHGGSETSTKAYVLPAMLSTATYTFDALIDADDTNNPTAGGVTDNVTITYYPRNPFIDNDKLGIAGSPSAEDEDATVTRSGQYSSTIYTQ